MRMIQYQRNVAQRGDALMLLRSLLDGCTPLVVSSIRSIAASWTG